MAKVSKEDMPIVTCLFCDMPIEFPQYIVNSAKYSGQIYCKECDTLFHIKKINTEIQEYKVVEKCFRKTMPMSWVQLVKLVDEEKQAKSS